MLSYCFLSNQVKNYSPKYMEQAPSRGHEASPQNGLGAGCKLCSSNGKLRAQNVRAQARCISIPPSFPAVGVSSFFAKPDGATGPYLSFC